MNGLADRNTVLDEGVIEEEPESLKEVIALDKVKRIINLSDNGYEYLSNQLMQEEGEKVEDILRQWGRERRK